MVAEPAGLAPGREAHVGHPESSRRIVRESLAAVRRHLGVEVAFVGRFGDGRRWVDFVDADAGFRPFEAGASDPVEETYCLRVADGRIPQLIPDTGSVQEVHPLPATWQFPVGSHIALPLESSDGVVIGTLCCFSREPDPDLRDRDLQVLRLFADVVSTHLQFLMTHEKATARTRQLLTDVIDGGGPAMALQPIVDLHEDRVYAYEALARFPATLGGTPDLWFSQAAAVGLGAELEAAAVRSALSLLPRLPQGTRLSLNLSAAALCDGEVAELFTADVLAHLVLELTEHTRVACYDTLTAHLARFRHGGAAIAVDDAGTGYAGLEHILRLRPDVLKLDRVLVDGVSAHPGKQAMVESMVSFTRRTGAHVVAEGVETGEDLQTLRGLGVPYAQGYYLGRPSSPLTP